MLLTVIGGDGVQAAKADQSTAASTGIECEAEFVAMSDAVHWRDPDEIAVARGALLEALGGDMNKLIDSVCIMAFFSGIADRTADRGPDGAPHDAANSVADEHAHVRADDHAPIATGGGRRGDARPTRQTRPHVDSSVAIRLVRHAARAGRAVLHGCFPWG